MDLRKRLADLDRLTRRPDKPQTPPQTVRQAPEGMPATAEMLTRMGLRPLDQSSLDPTLSSPWILEGREDLSPPVAPLPDLAGFFTRAQEADPAGEDILFLDTETTGLMGGTGTLAFLVGVGWWERGAFQWRQYLLPDFVAEAAMLEDLTGLAAGFQVVATFNGASFDLPLLRTRALMNRLPDPCARLVGWDLLVPGRRLWGLRLPDCRQQTLERHLLDWKRTAKDIDGSLIPQVWFDFLKEGRSDMMARVLHHNQRDLVGMAGIFRQVARRAELLESEPAPGHWRDAWALGRIAERRRSAAAAERWILAATEGSCAAPEAALREARFVADAVRILKRGAHWERVRRLLGGCLRAGLREPWVHREAAILYEHRLGRLQDALEHARLCGEADRIARLEKKQARIQGRI
ncbi:hypothetical protein CSB20_07875 [bacterium DOLZORAL124_64_63]|nr:MAG: hypothetical protein CSB20_07875 [bacterium DOLZORAL124_64_63]